MRPRCWRSADAFFPVGEKVKKGGGDSSTRLTLSLFSGFPLFSFFLIIAKDIRRDTACYKLVEARKKKGEAQHAASISGLPDPRPFSHE